MSLVLGLDCSGETYSAGLWSGKGERLEVSGSQPRRALRDLPGAIAHLLEVAGVRAGEISAVGVTQGPGSFTGVRLGITVAKTVATVARCPACGWDTLELLAHQFLQEGSSGRLAVALDARRRELYCGLFARTAGCQGIQIPLPTAVRSPDSFQSELARLGAFQFAVGSGFAAYPDILDGAWPGCRLLSPRACAPSGLLVAELSASEPSRWRPHEELVPVYHRRADIQVSPAVK